MSISSVVVAMVITVYVPLAGGINGGGVITRSGVIPATGMAACGWKYPFGTVFEIVDEDMSQYGLPQVVVCMDRGKWVGPNKVDITLVSSDVKGDLQRAKSWGKRTREVRIYPNIGAYREAKGYDPSNLHSTDVCQPITECAELHTAR